MPSGGARARSGPAPDPNALRRDRDKSEWTHLPASGREGEPPAWPLTRPRTRELALWADEWTRPQALMWEARRQELEVALYVRAVVVAEGPKATSSDRKLILSLMDDLGISGGGLARNRWIIDAAPIESSGYAAAGTDGRPSVKERLKVMDGGGA